MKILYAEDEKQLSVAVTEILKMEGFDVTPVYDGLKALELIREDYFDVVVLDIMMPVMDGIEVLQKMREEGNYTSVLMLTAKATVNDRITGLSSGADDYLAKPFAMKELVARLHSMIRRNTGYRHEILKASNIELNTNSCELKSDKGSLRLNNVEAELLAFFIKNPDAGYTSEKINELVWSGRESCDKAQLYAFYLKNKLRQIHSDLNIIIEKGTYALKEEKL